MTARDEYDMQYNIAMRDNGWSIFDMDSGVTVGFYRTRDAALGRMRQLNREAKA